jgi:hypothetical protein
MVIFGDTQVTVTLLSDYDTEDEAETVLTIGSGASNYSVSVATYPGTGSIIYPASGAGRLATGGRRAGSREWWPWR